MSLAAVVISGRKEDRARSRVALLESGECIWPAVVYIAV